MLLGFLNLRPVVYIGGLLSTLLFVEGWIWQHSTVSLYYVCYMEEGGRERERKYNNTDSENK